MLQRMVHYLSVLGSVWGKGIVAVILVVLEVHSGFLIKLWYGISHLYGGFLYGNMVAWLKEKAEGLFSF